MIEHERGAATPTTDPKETPVHIDRDHTADLMRNELLENLDRDSLVDAIRDQFINIVCDSDPDPIDHPMSYRSASPDQQAALRRIMAGVEDYIRAARMDDVAVERRIRLDLDDAA